MVAASSKAWSVGVAIKRVRTAGISWHFGEAEDAKHGGTAQGKAEELRSASWILLKVTGLRHRCACALIEQSLARSETLNTSSSESVDIIFGTMVSSRHAEVLSQSSRLDAPAESI